MTLSDITHVGSPLVANRVCRQAGVHEYLSSLSRHFLEQPVGKSPVGLIEPAVGAAHKIKGERCREQDSRTTASERAPRRGRVRRGPPAPPFGPGAPVRLPPGFRISLQLQPDTQTYLELGDLLRQVGRREQAITAYRYALVLKPDHPQAAKIGRHGDYVQDVCFEVDDVDKAFEVATSRGAEAAREPMTMEDSFGKVRIAAIHTYGDVWHSFINRDQYSGLFMPNFKPVQKKGDPIGIEIVDHVVGNVEWGGMNKWVQWYSNILGFEQRKVVLTLAAAKGSTITLSTEGEDAEQAMLELAKVIENGFGET